MATKQHFRVFFVALPFALAAALPGPAFAHSRPKSGEILFPSRTGDPSTGMAPAAPAAGFRLDYSCYFGGSKWERIQSVHIDSQGNIYVGGSTKSGDLPTTPGAYDRTGRNDGLNDGFVAKFSPQGVLQWCTYLDGLARDDVYGVRADASGNVYAAGWTLSSDFPTTPGAYDRTLNGESDAFVAKLSADGSTLLWCTLLGGSDKDGCRGSMALGADGRVYISGMTTSANFPVTAGAFQTSFGGGSDGYVAILSADGSTLERATYIGGSGADQAFDGVVIHADGTLSVAGNAGTADFPVTPGAFQTTFGGGSGAGAWPGDAYIARLRADLSGLVFSTFLGGSSDDGPAAQHSLAKDAAGNLVFAGRTESADFPVTPNVFQTTLRGRWDLFIAKVSADGSQLLASTYLGVSQDGPQQTRYDGYEASGVKVDGEGNIYLAGLTEYPDFPVTSNALQPVNFGQPGDVIFVKLSPDMDELLYSTFLGGTGGLGAGQERGRSLWLDASGAVYIVGDTNSSDFPMTDNSRQSLPTGGGDGYLVRLTPDDPGTITLGSFTATEEQGGVRVAWSTVSEMSLDGFRVYRSTSETGGFVAQNSSLIRGSSPYSWLDSTVEAATTYYYRLGAVQLGGNELFFGPVEVTTSSLRRSGDSPSDATFAVGPNPFLGSIAVTFSLAAPGWARLVVYDAAGRIVRVLFEGDYGIGDHTRSWDGRDADGRLVPAGVYLARFESAGMVETRKLVHVGP